MAGTTSQAQAATASVATAQKMNGIRQAATPATHSSSTAAAGVSGAPIGIKAPLARVISSSGHHRKLTLKPATRRDATLIPISTRPTAGIAALSPAANGSDPSAAMVGSAAPERLGLRLVGRDTHRQLQRGTGAEIGTGQQAECLRPSLGRLRSAIRLPRWWRGTGKTRKYALAKASKTVETMRAGVRFGWLKLGSPKRTGA